MSKVVPIDIKLRRKLTDLVNALSPQILLKIAEDLDKRLKRQQTPGARP